MRFSIRESSWYYSGCGKIDQVRKDITVRLKRPTYV